MRSRIARSAPGRRHRPYAEITASGAHLDAGRGTEERLPSLGTRALEAPVICDGPEFIGLGLDALRRIRRFASILRGDLPKYRARCSEPASEQDRVADASGR